VAVSQSLIVAVGASSPRPRPRPAARTNGSESP
jgi:hypothetical protein